MLFPESFRPVSLTVANQHNSPTSFFALHHSPSENGSQTQLNEKKILLVLHGYPQNHTLYYALIEKLAKRGVLEEWHIIIPDLPGCVSRHHVLIYSDTHLL